jgi:hypothetical protein
MSTNLRLTAIAFHRNGVGGRSFYAVAFRDLCDGSWRNLIATVFNDGELKLGQVHPSTGLVSVLDADMAAAGILTAPENQYRGDVYEPTLRQWVARHDVEVAARLVEIDRALAAARTGNPRT